jgi:hypothetical protein
MQPAAIFSAGRNLHVVEKFRELFELVLLVFALLGPLGGR